MNYEEFTLLMTGFSLGGAVMAGLVGSMLTRQNKTLQKRIKKQ